MRKLLEMIKRKPIVSIIVGVLVFQTAAVTAYAASFNSINFNLDGEMKSVTSRTVTVADLLNEQGIKVGEHDYLSVSLDDELTNDMEIKWIPAVQVELIIDGVTETKWTVEKTVADFLASEDIVLSEYDEISLELDSKVTEKMTIDISLAFPVVLKDGRVKTEYQTTATTVEDLLSANDVKLGKFDRIEPAITTELTEATDIEITRVKKKVTTKKERIPFKTIKKDDDSLLVGEEKVVTKGKKGTLEKKIETITENGKVVSKEVVSEKVKVKKVDKVIAVGTKEPQPEPRAQVQRQSQSTTNSGQTQQKKKQQPAQAPAAPVVSGNAGGNRAAVVPFARQLIGTPYRAGGTTPAGFDCSGFVYYSYQQVFGKTLPRSSAGMWSGGSSVSSPAPGDLVFFNTSGRGVSHVGIYIGGGSFIHSATYPAGVRIDSLSGSYWGPRYLGAKRY